jgi:hypothetical protein
MCPLGKLAGAGVESAQRSLEPCQAVRPCLPYLSVRSDAVHCLLTDLQTQKRSWSARTVLKIRIRKMPLICSATFALSGVVGWWGTVSNRGNRDEQLLFALLWGLSTIGATGFLFIPLMHQLSERSSQPEAADSSLPILHGDYVARHSIGDKIVSICLAAAVALITTFFFYHRTALSTRIVSSAMFCFLVMYAYKICFTAVRFTNQEIAIRIIPFVRFSEKYSNITELRAGRGNLQIRFTDGKTINMWSGLGDPGKVASILMHKTEVLPKVE